MVTRALVNLGTGTELGDARGTAGWADDGGCQGPPVTPALTGEEGTPQPRGQGASRKRWHPPDLLSQGGLVLGVPVEELHDVQQALHVPGEGAGYPPRCPPERGDTPGTPRQGGTGCPGSLPHAARGAQNPPPSPPKSRCPMKPPCAWQGGAKLVPHPSFQGAGCGAGTGDPPPAGDIPLHGGVPEGPAPLVTQGHGVAPAGCCSASCPSLSPSRPAGDNSRWQRWDRRWWWELR